MYHGKMIPVEAIPGIWGRGGVKDNGGRGKGEFKYDIFDTL
jgi:hypothetical protein